MAASSALNNVARAAVGIGAGVSLFQASIYDVDGGHRAVMFDRLRGVQVTMALSAEARMSDSSRSAAARNASARPRRRVVSGTRAYAARQPLTTTALCL